MAGVTGPTGARGDAGPQGATGQTGARGPIGSIASAGSTGSGWTHYRDFSFANNSDDIVISDKAKAREIADYLSQNPSARIAINGPSKRYVHSVVDALNDAGVSNAKMQTSPYDDSQQRSDHRVSVLVSSN